MSLTFDNPGALWLLLLLPAFFLVGRLGTAYLSRPVRRAAIGMRLALVAALALALAQPVLHRGSDLLSVIFLVDRSASVEVNQASTAEAFLKEALGQAGANDHVGIVEYGGNAVVRQALGADRANAGVPAVDASQTNLSSALHLATSLFPSIGARRIVVLSDGQSNAGDAIAEARQDSTRRVHIDVLPVGPPADFREVLVDSFSAPPSVRFGQEFDLSAVVRSSVAGNATLRFAMDGKPLSSGTVRLQAGANRFSVNVKSATKGFHTFEVDVDAPDDTYPQNNQAFAFTVVKETGHVAVVASDPKEAAGLIAALQSAQIQVTQLAPSAISPNLSAMKMYDGMVIVDTPATAFSLDQTKTIAGFVHDLGRGLLVIGGPQSYGQGKYDGTPLGDALPVVSGVPGNVESGSVALVLVIDKSGSMDEEEGGVRKMAMADKSAQLAIGLLAPNDDVGVIAFDTEPTWVVPVQKVGEPANRQRIQNLVGQIQASGGTDIFTALSAAYGEIHKSNARYKHIILMSDGNSLTESDYGPLLRHIQDEKITLSTIAIGSDADKNLMQSLATQGGGTYYYTDDPSKIPEITTRETRVVRGSAKVDASFQPQIVAPSPLLEGFVGRDLPQLGGYVVTTPRRNATVVLQSDRKDPILAHWNYGLGRVVAWTSDLDPQKWGASWLSWGDASRFWSQAMNWAMPPPGDPELQISHTVTGNVVDFRVEAVNELGVFEDLLDLRARVTGADGQPIEVPLIQTRSGRYEARFSIARPGAYPVDVVQYDPSTKVVRTETTGVVVSYPSEYREFGVNQEKLAGLAAVTGGRILHDPADVYSRDGLEFDGSQAWPLWQLLLALAALLFPLDVAIRRLRIDPIDLGKRGWTNGQRGLARGRAALGALRGRLGQRVRQSFGLTGIFH